LGRKKQLENSATKKNIEALDIRIRDQEAVHFVTFTTIQWLDPPLGGHVSLYELNTEIFL
jgi:hypothetical protein